MGNISYVVTFVYSCMIQMYQNASACRKGLIRFDFMLYNIKIILHNFSLYNKYHLSLVTLATFYFRDTPIYILPEANDKRQLLSALLPIYLLYLFDSKSDNWQLQLKDYTMILYLWQIIRHLCVKFQAGTYHNYHP